MRLGFKYFVDKGETKTQGVNVRTSVAVYGCLDTREQGTDSVAVTTKGNVVIHENGCVYGDILAKGSVYVEQNAKVTGNIIAQDVILVDGEVIGNVVSNKKIYASATGTIKGNITTPQMQLTVNTPHEGHILITGGKRDILEIQRLSEI